MMLLWHAAQPEPRPQAVIVLAHDTSMHAAQPEPRTQAVLVLAHASIYAIRCAPPTSRPHIGTCFHPRHTLHSHVSRVIYIPTQLSTRLQALIAAQSHTGYRLHRGGNPPRTRGGLPGHIIAQKMKSQPLFIELLRYAWQY